MFTALRDAFMRDNRDVDAAILAVELKKTERFVRMYRRKLGLTPLSGNKPRRPVTPSPAARSTG